MDDRSTPNGRDGSMSRWLALPGATAPASPVSAPRTAAPGRTGDGICALAAIIILYQAILMLEEILLLCGGGFYYSLCDAYIPLALSERIAHLHYGLNSPEPSAPASSILWPLLLAPFSATVVHVFVPLAINVLAAAATGALFTRVALYATRNAE